MGWGYWMLDDARSNQTVNFTGREGMEANWRSRGTVLHSTAQKFELSLSFGAGIVLFDIYVKKIVLANFYLAFKPRQFESFTLNL